MARRKLTVDRHEEIKRRLADGRSLREIATAVVRSKSVNRAASSCTSDFQGNRHAPQARIDRIADVQPRSKVATCCRRGVKVSIVAGQWVSKDAALRQCN
jgi:hypothetical protein